jgi:hypothetical protein
MAALSAKRSTERKIGDVGEIGCAVDICYQGGLAAVNAAGYIAPAGVAVTDRVVGVFIETVDNSGGSAGDVTARYWKRGSFKLDNSATNTLTVAHRGNAVYAEDDQTVGFSASAGPFAGILEEVDSDGVWVRIGDNSDGPIVQTGTATLASGTTTVSTGVVLRSDSIVFAFPTTAITGSTNFGCVQELAASRVNGAAGTASMVIRALGADGAIDADAAGTVRWVVITPQPTT